MNIIRKIAIITFSVEGLSVSIKLAEAFPEAVIFVHETVEAPINCRRFTGVLDLTSTIFSLYEGLVYIGPCGIVVRAIAPHIEHKLKDPAVVVLDVCARFAVSLLSGHEGGANELAFAVANVVGAEPVVTTTTDAKKRFIIGVGCRKGTPATKIIQAVENAVVEAGVTLDQVRVMASADIKSEEKGLLEAASLLGLSLRIIPSEDIRTCFRDFHRSDFVEEKVGLPGVAEPAALLAGRRTELILSKTKYNGVTVAVARESCSW